MGRIGKPKLKYILQTNNNVYEFLNKIAMMKFIKELEINNYKIDIVELN